MTLTAAVGLGQAVDGREAGLQAAHQALNGLGVATPALAFLFASNHYPPRDVLNGAISLLGDTPLIGLSSPAGLTGTGQHPHSVALALLAGEFEAQAHWLSRYSQSGRETAVRLAQLAAGPIRNEALLCFADGFSGDAEQFCAALQLDSTPVVGALSSGDSRPGWARRGQARRGRRGSAPAKRGDLR